MIWITGARGMLGAELARRLRKRGIACTGTDHAVDVTRPSEIDAFLRGGSRRPSWIVNCAAYTAVDLAEDEPGPAFSVNADGPRNLAAAARDIGASLLHISSDYVFAGDGPGGYREQDAADPRCVYGRSKLAGELAVRRELSRHVIVRTGWLYGQGGRNFVDTMRRRFTAPGRVRVVADQRGSPTWTGDLADALARILGSEKTSYGVFHLTNRGSTTWFELAWSVYLELLNRGAAAPGVELDPVTSEEFAARAPRPGDSTLCLDKIERMYGIVPRGWRDALRDYLSPVREPV